MNELYFGLGVLCTSLAVGSIYEYNISKNYPTISGEIIETDFKKNADSSILFENYLGEQIKILIPTRPYSSVCDFWDSSTEIAYRGFANRLSKKYIIGSMVSAMVKESDGLERSLYRFM